MPSDYQLTGKVALVTGVSRRIGIGAAIASALARADANIFTTYYRPYDGSDNDPEEAEQIIEELRALGVQAIGREADLSDPNTAKNLFNSVEAELGRVDILVNNATHDVLQDIDTLTVDELDAHYAVNVRGTTLLCTEFVRRHDGRPGGRIINLTSGQGLHPMPDNLPYAITKGAVEALTTSLSAGVKAKGITVNAIDPGGTDTGWMTEPLQAQIRANALYGRVGTPEDAARLGLFLASPQSDWITGQILRSRGGI